MYLKYIYIHINILVFASICPFQLCPNFVASPLLLIRSDPGVAEVITGNPESANLDVVPGMPWP